MPYNSAWWEKRAPLVIAHRGASFYAPENTMAAFRTALEVGADGLEFDVKLTGDGEVVVLHDQTLERTTDGRGSISDFNLEEIEALDAGRHFGRQYTGERVPRLAEVLDTFGGLGLLNIELTNYAQPLDSLSEKVVDLVCARGLARWSLISSFNPLAILRVRWARKGIPVALLVSKQQPRLLRWALRRFLRYDALHIEHSVADVQSVGEAKAQGRLVNVWTVNVRRQMSRFLRMGVTGLITDVPDRAKDEIRAFLGSRPTIA